MIESFLGAGTTLLFLPWLLILILPFAIAVVPLVIICINLKKYITSKERMTTVLPILTPCLNRELKQKLKFNLKSSFDTIRTVKGESFVKAYVEEYQGFYSGYAIGTCSEGSFTIKALADNPENLVSKLVSKVNSAKINFPGNLDRKISVKKFLQDYSENKATAPFNLNQLEI